MVSTTAPPVVRRQARVDHRLRSLWAHLCAASADESAPAAAGDASHVVHQQQVATTSDMGWPALGLAQPEYVRAPRLAPGSPAVGAHLAEHGFAVVAGALALAEVREAMDRVWALLEGQRTGVDRRTPCTWTNDRWSPGTCARPERAHSGSHDAPGLLQSEALWFIRTRPGLRRLWAAIYGCAESELMVSMDGLNLVRPWHLCPDGQSSWRTRAQWPHIDGVRQGGTPDACVPAGGFDPDVRYYVQGVVNLVKSGASGGGNVVVRGSHRHFEELEARYFKAQGSQRITAEIVERHPHIFYQKVIMAHAEAGDVILWDDRTIHCNHPGVTGKQPKVTGLLRAAAYVTMVPSARAMPVVLQSRRRCIDRGWDAGSGGWCAHRRVIEPPTTDTTERMQLMDALIRVFADGRSSKDFVVAPRARLDGVAQQLVCGGR
jgi:hypothetical protein